MPIGRDEGVGMPQCVLELAYAIAKNGYFFVKFLG